MKRLLPILVLAFGHAAHAQPTYFPPTTGTPWETLPPSALGWCPDSIAALIDYLDDEQSKAFIVLKDGRIVIEHYFDTFTQDSLWYWASAGKTLTAFLTGKAEENGLFSISDRTSDHLGTGWTTCPAEKEELITIRHQLTMTTGLDDTAGDPNCLTPACLQYLSDAGTRWAYHNAPYTKLRAVIEAASGQNYNQFTNQNIKQQTGMDGYWVMLGDNNVFFSKARSMARYGLLIQANGIWDGDTLLHNQQYIHDMTHPSQELNASYGYLWWLAGQSSYMVPTVPFVLQGDPMPSAPDDMFAGLGKDGQVVSVSPSQGLVVVRMGQGNGSSLVALELAENIWNRINNLSCVISSDDIPPDDRMRAYPNPASETLTLQGSWATEGSTVVILNALGQLQKEIPLPADRTVDVSDLSAGVYLLRLTTGDASTAIRFMKD